MNAKHVLAGMALLVMAACGGGGGGGGTPPTNEPPTLTFETTVIAVPTGTAKNLTVAASDPDGDPLTITWTSTGGTLVSQNAANTVVQWTAPGTAGTDTLTITADDGTESTTLKVQIKAGTKVSTLPGSMTKSNSPYILAPVNVPPTMNAPGNFTTTIQAGVELLVDKADMLIYVHGELKANGTAGEPIVIRPNNRTFKCTTDQGWWEGFRGDTDDAVISDGFIDFEYVEIRGAKWSVRLVDNSSALLRNCKIQCSSVAGVLIEGNGSLRAFDSRISDGATDGIAIAALSSLPDSVRIDGCTLAFNDNAGIRMDLNDTSFLAGPIIVDHNQIEFNGAYGISLSHSVFPSIHYNAFRGNGASAVINLFLAGGYPGVAYPTLDATCNFWGSNDVTSQAVIDESIRDSLDAPGGVNTRVDSCPWLNSNPFNSTPSCTCPPED